MIYAKLAGLVLAVTALFAAGWYFSGLRGAAALDKAQTQYATNVAKQAKLAAAAVQRAQDSEAAARAHNQQVSDDLTKELNAADARGLDLAERLRNALTSADGFSASAEVANRQLSAATARVASSESRLDDITRAVARYDTACQRDASRYTALIAEIKPQL